MQKVYMTEKINELVEEDPIMPWCREVAENYENFMREVEAGNIPGLTIEMVREVEKELGGFK